MKNRILGSITTVVMMSALLSLAGGLACAADNAPLTPEFAAKKENYRKQREQQITPEKKKAAAEALKAERFKVYQARQAVKQSQPETTDNK
jgi:predicted outer membrane protein